MLIFTSAGLMLAYSDGNASSGLEADLNFLDQAQLRQQRKHGKPLTACARSEEEHDASTHESEDRVAPSITTNAAPCSEVRALLPTCVLLRLLALDVRGGLLLRCFLLQTRSADH